MSDDRPSLAAATRAEIIAALASALRFERRTRHHLADDLLSVLAAEHIADQLEDRFVLTRRPVLALPLKP